MAIEFDLELDIFLEIALEHIHNDNAFERVYVKEIFPSLAYKIHDESISEDVFEMSLVEDTIARIRHEALKIDREAQSYFENFPEPVLENIYVTDIDGSKRYLTEEEVYEIIEHVRSYLLTNKLVPLFNISNELIKIRTAELMSKKILDEKYAGEKGKNWILENEPIAHRHRPDFLKKCGVVSDELKEDIESVIKTRNDLVHDLKQWVQLDDPEELHSSLEKCISTIEALDYKLHYPPQVRMYEEDNIIDVFGIDPDNVRSNIGNADLSEASEAVGDALLQKGLTDKESHTYRLLEEKFKNDEYLKGVINEFWKQELSEIDDENEFEEAIIRYAVEFARYFGINIFRRLLPYQEEFDSRIPEKYFCDEFVNKIDSVTEN